MTGSSTRNEKNWNSSIFSESMIEKPTRKHLAKKDSGNVGLYGDEKMVYEKRVDHPVLNPTHQSKDIQLIP